MTTKTFTFVGSPQTWTVPPGVTSIAITCNGAAGGNYTGVGTNPNRGGQATGTLAVTPGQLLYIYVGGQGQPPNGNNYGVGGYNFGARGGIGTGYPTYYGGAGGGGCSEVRVPTSTTPIHVIMAGGGGGRVSGQVGGGAGGGLTGGAGTTVGGTGYEGLGGTPTAGGAYGGGGGGGTAGTLNSGGLGGGNTVRNGAGGGGGGLYGGGGGGLTLATGVAYGGGGGGSSYYGGVGITLGATTLGGGSTGNGSVIFVYNVPPNAPRLLNPPPYQNIDVTQALALQWSFSDPDFADTQGSADVQYRIVGSGTWTTIITAATTVQQYVIAASTLTTASQYEWQVRTADTTGAMGGWCGSGIFNTAGGPSAPTALSPATAGTFSTNPQTVTWTTWASGQSGHRVIVFDHVTPTIVYYDSGVVASGTPSQSVKLPATFPSGTLVDMSVQYFLLTNVWSPKTTSTSITTALSPPDAPQYLTFTPNVAAGSLTVAIAYAGTGVAPVTGYLYRLDVNDTSATEVCIAILSASLGGLWPYTDNTVGFNRLYRYRAVAFSAAGGGTSS